jgi:hypothetical protein
MRRRYMSLTETRRDTAELVGSRVVKRTAGARIKELLAAFIADAVMEHKAAVLQERKAALRGGPELPRCEGCNNRVSGVRKVNAIHGDARGRSLCGKCAAPVAERG